jgi:membrane protein YdbS with pleckstrin-like domain
MIMEERGIVIRRARISYVYNYMMMFLIAILFIVSWYSLGLTFSFAPQNFDVFWKTAVVIGFVAVLVFLLEEPELDRWFKYYVITNNDVILTEGIIRKSKITIPLQSISNVDVHKGVLGRIFNFGDVTVMGFKNTILMESIPEPEVFYRIINNKISVITGTKQRVVHEKPVKKKKRKKQKGWREKERLLRKGRKKSRGMKLLKRKRSKGRKSKEL